MGRFSIPRRSPRAAKRPRTSINQPGSGRPRPHPKTSEIISSSFRFTGIGLLVFKQLNLLISGNIALWNQDCEFEHALSDHGLSAAAAPGHRHLGRARIAMQAYLELLVSFSRSFRPLYF